MINKRFGKIVNGVLEYAPYPLVLENDTKIYTYDANAYLKCGYKTIVESGALTSHFTMEETEKEIIIKYFQTIEDVRALKLEELSEYDVSDNVNGFTIHGVEMWLDGLDRCKLEQGVKDCIKKGRETYGLCIPDVGVLEMPCEKVLEMLAEIDVYAVDCFRTTFLHSEAIKALTTIEEIDAYDFTTGYPEKPVFE